MRSKFKYTFCTSVFLMMVAIGGCSKWFEPYHSEGNGGGSFKLGDYDGSFKSVFNGIIKPKCTRCHSGSDAPHSIYLDSYESIRNSGVFPPLVIPKNPEESSLYTSVKDGSMPKKAPRLSKVEIDAIYQWIKDGALKEPANGGGDDGDNPDDPGGVIDPFDCPDGSFECIENSGDDCDPDDFNCDDDF